MNAAGTLGFAPDFNISAMAYYVRMALMNMSNPIYQTFVMEKVDASDRTTVASLYSMVWNSGRAFSPSIRRSAVSEFHALKSGM